MLKLSLPISIVSLVLAVSASASPILKVELVAPPDDKVVATTYTDASGKFTLPAAGEGTYAILVTGTFREPVTLALNGSPRAVHCGVDVNTHRSRCESAAEKLSGPISGTTAK